jgi:hypothetical protein
MLRTVCVVLPLVFSAGLEAATIRGFSAGFANSTPGFWGIEFQNGSAAERIQSISLTMPGPGFFDLDGIGNYQNQTAPIFDPASSAGLNSGDLAFSFAGSDPITLNLQFAPGTFAPGDRIQFAADIGGLGSKLGGALGAYGGVSIAVRLEDGRTGTANFSTNTSVQSQVIVDIAAAPVPEPRMFLPLATALLWCTRRLFPPKRM